MIRTMLIGALMLAATPGFAADRKAAGQADPNRMICRSEPVTGSRLATKRRCLTAAQWNELERRQNDDARYLQSHRQQTGNQ